MKLIIDCSPEQMEVLGDHFIEGKALGMQPDERHWMLSQARKKMPDCKIVSAELDEMNGHWILEVTSTPKQ